MGLEDPRPDLLRPVLEAAQLQDSRDVQASEMAALEHRDARAGTPGSRLHASSLHPENEVRDRSRRLRHCRRTDDAVNDESEEPGEGRPARCVHCQISPEEKGGGDRRVERDERRHGAVAGIIDAFVSADAAGTAKQVRRRKALASS